MFGDMEEVQKQMREQLATIQVEAEAGDGAVIVHANGNREITNISINKSALDWEDSEQVEDLVMVAVNRAIAKAAEQEALASQEMIKNMLPPGMGGLGNLFG